MKKIILVLIVSAMTFFLPSDVFAYDFKFTYEKDVESCFTGLRVTPSYDNNGEMDGYFLFLKSTIIKMNLENEMLFEKKYADFNTLLFVDTISKKNTDYTVSGDADLLFIFSDDNGNEILKKQYGGNGYDSAMAHFNSYNNAGVFDGYVVVFYTDSSDLNVDPGYVMLKMDPNGNIIYEKNINAFIYTKMLDVLGVVDIKNKMIDSSIVFTYYNSIQRLRIKGVPMGTNTTILWEKNPDIKISNINYSYNKDGVVDGVIAVGYDNNGIGTIVKYDLDGNEVFKSTYNSDVKSVFNDFSNSWTPDGYDGYIVTAVSSNNKTLILKYGYDGKLISEIVFLDNRTLLFNVVESYDSDVERNGYFLYSVGAYSFTNITANDDANACDNIVIARYTYDKFPVVKETSESGVITVNPKAYPGEVVKVDVEVKEGYSLKKIVVKDENGNEIEVSSDGTFIMPEGKVTVSAIYNRIVNPDTVSACYVVLGIILIIAIGSAIVTRERSKESA